MKRKSSCQACRESHRRCVTRPRATKCNSCDELGRDCNFSPKFQFRPWKSQATERCPGTPSVSVAEDHVDSEGVDMLGNSPDTHHMSGVVLGPGIYDSNKVYSSSLEAASPGISIRGASSLRHATSIPNAEEDMNSESPTSQRQIATEPGGIVSLRPGDSPLTRQSRNSFDRASVCHKLQSTPSASSRFTQREAFLFRTWTEKIALVSDAVDDARHFGVVASRLALDHPVLLNGIFAVSSRFDALATGSGSEIESSYYHGRCIELLIDLLLKPPDTYDSTLLAAVVVSRLYEENDIESDAITYHLSGTRTLLSNDVITRITAEGGLAEAACWLHLRQATYVAIVHRKQPNTPLEVYKGLTAFRKTDDTSYANRMVYLFARVLVAFFPDSAAVSDGSLGCRDTWDFLQQELDDWFEARPSSFLPLYHELPDIETDKPFPCMWMVSTVPTVALQHYYSSLIVLSLNKCNGPPGESGFEAARRRRTNEKVIASHLCILMGLAFSNPHAPNAWYQPCHMLDLCGYCIRSPTERVHTIQYLEAAKKEVQWKTAPVIAALQKQWAELDSFEI